MSFTTVFLILLALKVATDMWLETRHKNHVFSHRGEVPPMFAEKISLEAHQRAADYTLTKLRFGALESIISVLLLLFWTLGGGLEWLDQAMRGLEFGPLMLSTLFMLAFILISSIIDIPLSLYRTFGIEAAFGFNRSTVGLFFVDKLKGMALTLLIGGPLILLIIWLMQAAGNNWWLYAWGVWTGFSFFMMWAYPTFIAPLFNKFRPLEDESLKARIEALLERCGFKSNGLFVMDGSKRSSHGNAYFSGLGNAKRIVFFDTLLESLEPEETEAVLAHELGHFKKKHIRKRMLWMVAITFGAFALLGYLGAQEWFYHGLGMSTPSSHALLTLFTLALPVFTFMTAPLSSWLSRKHEFEADDFAAEHADGNRLISALVRMYKDNAATLTPDPLYSAWHDSHPPAPIRIAHLQRGK